MRHSLAVLIAMLAVSAIGVPLAAHHSYSAEFDDSKPVTLEGTVTRMEWVNPHAVVHIAAKNSDGTVQAWSVEANSPNILIRRGLSKESILSGMEVSVGGYRAKDGSTTIAGVAISFKDGRRVFVGSKLVWPWPPKKPSD
jgi:hypothetical protein